MTPPPLVRLNTTPPPIQVVESPVIPPVAPPVYSPPAAATSGSGTQGAVGIAVAR